jgi:UDP-glucose 4-epimerase
MKILVTGASGQLGSYLVEKLSAEHEVTGLDIRPTGHPVVGAEHVKGDIGDYRLAMTLCRGKDAVIHTAAQVSVERSISDPVLDARENILGTVNMLETATKSMVGQFIYISSAAIYGNPVSVPIDEEHPTRPLSPYGVSKLAGENYTFAFRESYGMGVTAIRPFNIYSLRQDPNSPYSGVISKFVDRAKAGEPLTVFGDGKNTRDFIHVSDVVRMVGLCLGNGKADGHAFNCGSGKATSINELADSVASLSGGNPDIEHADPRKGDIVHSVADIAKAKKILGFRPSMKLGKGLAEFF